jgi:hypothetical protein
MAKMAAAIAMGAAQAERNTWPISNPIIASTGFMESSIRQAHSLE